MGICRDHLIVLLPEKSKSMDFVRNNAVTGYIADKDLDGVYDTLELFFPRAYGGVDIAVVKSVMALASKFFSDIAVNVNVKDVSSRIEEDTRMEYLARAQSRENIDLQHVVIMKGNMSNDEFIRIPILDVTGSVNPTVGGGEATNTAVPGYLYEPTSSTPLVLNKDNQRTIELISGAIANREQIFKQYGLSSVMDSSSMCFLFHGPSGTGKTQTAKYLAKKLNKKLLIVDHSKLIDKYVGETEKRIAEVFAYAEKNDCILLFDEADSLIGSRTSSEHSWEIGRVNTLLQHMEKSNSVTIFATNYADHLDSAVNRRLLFKVGFSLPDKESRKEIWKALLPSKAPKQRINYNKLSEMELTGGEIKNAIVVAIVKCSSNNAKITNKLLLEASATVVKERLTDLYSEERARQAKSDRIGFGQEQQLQSELR